MADYNIFLMVWSASWPVTPHIVADVHLKKMSNVNVQPIKTAIGNEHM